MSSVSIIKCKTYKKESVYQSVKKAINLIGGIDKIVKPGQNVLLKINLLSAQPPEKAITTHPSIVGAMVRLLKKAGINVWVGDAAATGGMGEAINSRSKKESCDPFDITGIREATEKEGGQIVNFSRTGYIKIKIPGAKQLKQVYIARKVLDADIVISLPKLKTHTLTFLTGAVKNFFGCIPSSDRFRAHRLAQERKFAQAVVDVYSVCKPSLALMDAIVAMEGEGPSSGEPAKLGLLLASNDCVSLDIVASKIVGFRPQDILTSKEAMARGLGPHDLEEVTILGCKLKEVIKPDFKKPSTYQGRIKRALIRVFTPVGIYFFRNFPVVKKSACKRCGICMEKCPANAITMEPYPKIDYQKCIQCFCCHEFCPSRAIYIRKNWLRERLS